MVIDSPHEPVHDQDVTLVGEHEHSFWLDRDVGRKAQWEEAAFPVS